MRYCDTTLFIIIQYLGFYGNIYISIITLQ